MRTHTLVTLAAVGMLALAAAPARSQSVIARNPQSSRIAQAVALEDQAVALHAQPGRAFEAAYLHLRSASLRDPGDPAAVQSLAMAAHLLGYADRPLEARRAMEQAAERALALGDIVRAASAYTEAAFFAQKANSKDQVNRLGRKAILLASSPLLRAEERQAILGRFRTNPTFAVLVK